MKVRLRDLCHEERLAIPANAKKSLPFLGLDQIEAQTGRILPSNHNGEASGEGLGFYYSKKHVLYSKLRPYLNKIALPEQEGRCSTELIPLAPAEGVEREYLAFLLRSPFVLKRAVSANNGSRMPRADLNMLFKMEVDCPDLPTQRRIAARLKKQMTAVDEMRQAAKEQEGAVMPLFEKTLAESFHGITPLSLGIRADEAPAGWQWRRLLDLARLESGHTPSRRHPEYWENGDIPWLALPDIRALDCQVVHDTSEHTNPLGIANSSARILPENTVALCRTASVGRVTILGCPLATSQHFANWICGPDLEPRFLMWLLRAARAFIQSKGSGSVLPDVYMNVIVNFHVCLPNLGTQRAIARRMDEVFRQTESLRQTLSEQIEAISALPGAYLAQAFSSSAD